MVCVCVCVCVVREREGGGERGWNRGERGERGGKEERVHFSFAQSMELVLISCFRRYYTYTVHEIREGCSHT